MRNDLKPILLAFATYEAMQMLREILWQLDKALDIEWAGDESVLFRCLDRRPPGLIIIDNPFAKVVAAAAVNRIRSIEYFSAIPIACFVPQHAISSIMNLTKSDDVYFFPRPVLPSECKYYLRQMLELYTEAVPFGASPSSVPAKPTVENPTPTVASDS